MKIKISADYDSSENLTERLLLQFKTDEIDLSGLEFVYDESYDVIVFFNYINNKIVEGKDSFVFPHEPSWNGSHQKFFEKNVTVFGFDCGLYQEKWKEQNDELQKTGCSSCSWGDGFEIGISARFAELKNTFEVSFWEWSYLLGFKFNGNKF